MAEQDQDKTEEASPFKLNEARRRGQVWKSMELTSLLVLSSALAFAYWNGKGVFMAVANVVGGLLDLSGQIELQPTQAIALYGYMLKVLATIFAPFLAAVVIAGILANVFQTGPVFSLFPLKPDFSRLNPAQGLKRLFSARLLFETVKSLVKLVLFTTVIYFAIVAALPTLLGLMDTDPKVYAGVMLRQISVLGFKVLAVLALIVFMDLMFTRWDYAKRMRMSRREVKDEVKRREGDPQIRAKLRELQREAARRAGSVRRVPEADVLITNPTRLAIALKYERGKMVAPHVIAKGAGELAAKMREVARKSDVPIVENKPLARALFRKTGIDQPVGQELFPPTAKVLAWVFSMRRLKAARLAGEVG